MTSLGKNIQELDDRTLEACTKFRALDTVMAHIANLNPNMVIYTVGFSTPTDQIDGAGLALLRNCATPENDADRARSLRYSFVATNGDEIVSVFAEIARSFSPLRLAR